MTMKESFRRVAGAVRCALALGLIGHAVPARAQLTVTYVANEGFLLEGGGHRVLIDALFAEGISPYPAIPSALRPALETGRPPFDDIDVVFATHHHADHFDAETVARYLRTKPRTRFVSTPQAVERLRQAVGDEPGVLGRTDAVLPSEGHRARLAPRGLEVQVLNLHHGRGRNPPVQNLGFLIEMGGVRWLHVGDTEVNEDDVRPYALGDEAIDVAFLPTWLLGGGTWSRVVERQIRPAAIVVMHGVVDGAPAAYYEPDRDAEGQLRRIHARFPRAVVFAKAGDSKVFARPRERSGGSSAPLALAGETMLKDRDAGCHVIEYEVTLDAPPAEVFELWSTAEGLKRFLAPGARVDGTVGGLYQITFDPEGDPEGAKHGTKGARLLHLVPGKELAAEWTFPPLGEKLNTPPFPTWIEMRVAPAPGHPGRTRLHFAHYGFADDPDWEKAWRFFNEGNWPLVLNRLIVYCRDGVSPAWSGTEGDRLDRFVRKETTLPASVEDVWRSWTTEKGVLFLAGGAHIELVPGGAYEWYIDMSAPEGSRGGEGNTVLSVEPKRFLAFEWSAPPRYPEVRRQRFQVLLQLGPQGDGQTHLVLTALGFGAGPQWRDVHAYFERAWDVVLERLKVSLE